MDSRSYRFIYSIAANSDIPDDFPKEIRECSFVAGVFLPQDDSNWYTRPPQFPARLLLLRDQSIWIVPHPTSSQPPVEIAFRDLTQLETGYILLLGWMKFTARGGVQEITYNTRASRPLETFLILLRKQWLRDGSPGTREAPVIIGDPLDLKFRNLLHFELDAEEGAYLQCFQPPVRFEKKYLLLKRIHSLPGHLLLLTSANRILWITDDYRRHRELYAAISRSAPARLFQSCHLENAGAEAQLVLSFQDGGTWRLPVRNAADDASAFSEALRKRTAGSRAPSR